MCNGVCNEYLADKSNLNVCNYLDDKEIWPQNICISFRLNKFNNINNINLKSEI